MKRVLVGGPLVGSALEHLAAIAEVIAPADPIGWTREELLARVPDADALIALPSQRIDRELLDRAPLLCIVANHAVGVDNIDLVACRERGLPVTNTPKVLTEATADLTFALILDACRRVTEGDRAVRAGLWRGWGPTVHLGRRVHGATLGIIGFGRIGRAVAERARGFSMKVLYASPRPAEHAAEHVSLEDLLARADIITLHAPLNDSTRGLLSRARLESIKRGAILVNTARGALIDEAALIDLLASGHLAAAALDVYTNEPALNPALLTAPNLTLAPHIGSADHETRAAMAALACDSVRAALTGQPIPNRVG